MPSRMNVLETEGELSLFSGRRFQIKELIAAVLHLSNKQRESELYLRSL